MPSSIRPEPKKKKHQSERLVAVSNRLPIAVKKLGNLWHVERGSGGLVTAINPVLKNRGGLWIGWSGTTEKIEWGEELNLASHESGYNLHPVTLTPEEVEYFYFGFANQIIWPLFHDLHTRCNFDPDYWYYYLQVNKKYAETIASHSQPTDYIWVHDYHLVAVAQALRKQGLVRRTGFFLHIPFPSVDIFMRLPWRAQVLQALLEYDLIGFQTIRDRRNFIQCLQYISPGLKANGRGAVLTLDVDGRQVRVGAFPISIDFENFATRAGSTTVSTKLHWLKDVMLGSQIILGVDRLDYTKGVPERLRSFQLALEKHPDLRRKLTLVQIVVPSRTDVPEYQTLKQEVERLVGEINGKYTYGGWVPVQYMFRNLEMDELLAYYRSAQIAIVTPLKDGMNLVAKEYCACNLEEEGVLILSEFAGAASQLQRGALLVNPHDLEGVAEAIYHAFTMHPDERRGRMRRLRESLRRHDIFWWVDSYLKAAFSKKLGDFPTGEEYVPQIRLSRAEEH
jgi:trehalose 6-phosphate synthase